MRKSGLFLIYLAGNILLLAAMFGHAAFRTTHAGPLLESNAALVASLGLSDLCLFTEASYTRHLTQTDIHTPFQDGPLSLEHFPSGTILVPPAMLKQSYAKSH
jgi:hypothetical protein